MRVIDVMEKALAETAPKITAKVAGYVTFNGKPETSAADMVRHFSACRDGYVLRQPGILAQYLLSDGKGRYLDLVLAEDATALQKIAAGFTGAKEVGSYMAALEEEGLEMCNFQFSGQGLELNPVFQAAEFGWFQATTRSQSEVEAVSARVAADYLANEAAGCGHALGVTSEQGYCDATFSRSYADTLRICEGYLQDPAGQGLVALVDEGTAQMHFWVRLA
ncbi:hypothetical protein [Polycladidibacter hongkongensis]|uniref:hypothetical protein n=1 Tax=Polycladidibacter hongkongensis TaxID=1647556 RepID=UPI000829D92D|nr:hypothetical protein [Pseudovibrio hongkongensis]